MHDAAIHEALQSLIAEWVPAARDWYLDQLLPALDENPSLAREHELAAMERIRALAPNADLRALVTPMAPDRGLSVAERARYHKLVERLGALVTQNAEQRAGAVYASFPRASEVGTLPELLRLAKARAELAADAEQRHRRRLHEARAEARRALAERDLSALERLHAEGGEIREIAEKSAAVVGKEIVRSRFPQGDAEKEAFLATLTPMLC